MRWRNSVWRNIGETGSINGSAVAAVISCHLQRQRSLARRSMRHGNMPAASGGMASISSLGGTAHIISNILASSYLRNSVCGSQQ